MVCFFKNLELSWKSALEIGNWILELLDFFRENGTDKTNSDDEEQLANQKLQ